MFYSIVTLVRLASLEQPYIRATLHRYSAFAFVQRTLKQAVQMIGVAPFIARQTGLEKQPAVQEKLSELAIWREGINAQLNALIARNKAIDG